jgi:hypothetical protein
MGAKASRRLSRNANRISPANSKAGNQQQVLVI